MSKVFITGIGVVFPGGNNAEQLWQYMLEEATQPVKGFDIFSDRIANRYIFSCEDVNEKNSHGRTEELAMNAVHQAIKDSQLGDEIKLRGGLSIGTTMGDESELESSRFEDGFENAKKDFPFQMSSTIASSFGLCGPNLTISNACTSGLYAIDMAAESIRRGDADLMIAGGVESSSRIVLSCFNRLGALDEGKCRPFDTERKGTVLGEGAAFVVLESEESMLKRGYKNYYCEYKASGWSCDAHQPTAPEPGGEQIERALREALTSSDIKADEINCILPHGTGTPLNDALEVSVLTKIFGGNEKLPYVTAIKSRLGHSGGASGAFSIVVACLIFKHKLLPTTVNLESKESSFEFPIPIDEPIHLDAHNILVNAYAFGGNNISVVVGR
ncbi:beta-ketoacyl-[acyl-carrier-protein] synthase family protein [Aliikangiella sp. IMCC44359]|uniref:beta-ketoacyl-[acyl-carrier-protein] synthase family protein n=1 Tax=Aliikangiella sp. IMCC44359 TaxID=3459125 RepID=UPI00403ACC48